MKILVVIDSFKGTITSTELGEITCNKLNSRNIKADYIPISDGGDGFLDVIEAIINCKRVYLNVKDPLRRIINTYYLVDDNNAYIELAKPSGINLLNKNEYNPLITTTFGFGEMIKHAINNGFKNIILGIGGSATNDGGVGLLEALGCKFFNENNELISNISCNDLDNIKSINRSDFLNITNKVKITILSDVTNPLIGENGATYIYSKQKGAKENQIQKMENKMIHYKNIVQNTINKDYSDSIGAGAAGGVGFCLKSFFDFQCYSGIEYILKLVDFDNLSKDYDLIITGEGKIDKQSLNGKVVFEISKRAKGKKIIFVCGVNEISELDTINQNIYKIYSVVNERVTKEESINNPYYYFNKLIDKLIEDIVNL